MTSPANPRMLLLTLALTVSSIQVSAEIPNIVSYQGYLTDGGGNPLDGDYTLTFSVYDVSSGGTALWTSGEQGVSVSNGIFSYNMGQSVPLPVDLFDYPDRWLGIKVGVDPEIAPRTILASVPYALKSGDSGGGNGWTKTGNVVHLLNDTDTVLVGMDSYVGNAKIVFENANGKSVKFLKDNAGQNYNIYSHAAGDLGDHAVYGYFGDTTASRSTSGALAHQYYGAMGRHSYNSCVSIGYLGGGGAGVEGISQCPWPAMRAENEASGNTVEIADDEGCLLAIHDSSGNEIQIGKRLYGVYSKTYDSVSVGVEAYHGIGGVQARLASRLSAVYGNAGSDPYSVAGHFDGPVRLDGNLAVGSHVATEPIVVGKNVTSYDGEWIVIGDDTPDESTGLIIGEDADNHGWLEWGINGNRMNLGTIESGAWYLNTLNLKEGRVGVNCTDPSEPLVIGKNLGSYSGNRVVIGDDQAGVGTGLVIGEDDDNYSHMLWRVDFDYLNIGTTEGGVLHDNTLAVRTGQVGIGTGTPLQTLDVRGTIGNGGTVYHSDRRWKQGIKKLEGSLNRVLHLQGVHYTWKQEEYPEMNFPDGEQIGLIAQEVEKIVPEVVNESANGYKSIDYAKLVTVLIESVKEQQEQIETLSNRIEELERTQLSSR